MTDPLRTAAREAARLHLAALFPDHGLTPDVAEGIADAVLDTVQPLIRAEVLSEAETAIRELIPALQREYPEEPSNSPWCCGVQDAATEISRLAATAPTSQENPDA